MAQPPSAVSSGRSLCMKAEYQRNLPHYQREGAAYFVTFATWKRWELPPAARGIVLRHCLHDHAVRYQLHGAVIMPDHVHLVLTPLSSATEGAHPLSALLSGLKGASAHSINRELGHRGHVWQDESFDHILRNDESLRAKVEYVCENPIRKGLVRFTAEYPWLWREWIEGETGTQPRAAVPHEGGVRRPGCTAEGGCAPPGNDRASSKEGA